MSPHLIGYNAANLLQKHYIYNIVPLCIAKLGKINFHYELFQRPVHVKGVA